MHTVFDKRLSALDPDWGLISTWYRQILSNGAIDPFPVNALNDIAAESLDFWGGGDDNPRTHDIIIAEIAERVGWGTNTVPEQSTSAPQFTKNLPIDAAPDPSIPIDVDDQVYRHGKLKRDAQAFETECEEGCLLYTSPSPRDRG